MTRHHTLACQELLEGEHVREERKDIGAEELLLDRSASGGAVGQHRDLVPEIERLQRTRVNADRGHASGEDDPCDTSLSKGGMKFGV